ncbi:MAG: RluA family pseudouridine synthase [Lewinellaceae bacterium]|nr:RluA family pseudouridine synthase [Saprospiraceae bacterium]MCB9341183.1 RluA family pseudouridine synthase [Lewinellaceae bacterium]
MRPYPDRLMAKDELYEKSLFIADPNQGLMRLDKFITDRMFKVARNKVQNAIKAGLVKVNGTEEKANYKVKPGDKVEMMIPKPYDEAVKALPDDIPLNIHYEDDHLIIINKPAGMVVHPGVGNYRRTLVNALVFHFQNLPVMEGNPENRPGLIHRIDKNTSGLIVIGKTEKAIYGLAKQFYDHSIHRRYQAIVWGEPEEDEGTIKNYLARHPRFRKKMAVVDDGTGKWACTHWKVLERLYYVSLMEMKLETGRTHQIRVHMSNMGHPLFNDEKYGGDRIMKGTIFTKYKQFVENCFDMIPRQALHAKELGFIHPITGKEVFFESDLPEEFGACLERWRTYVTDRKAKLTLTD